MKKALLLLAVCCLLAGCSNNEADVGQVPSASVSTESGGVFYPAVSEKEIGQVCVDGLRIFDYLYYNGSIYTSSYNYASEDKSAVQAKISAVSEDKLADIFNNEYCWSEDSEKLAQVSENTSAVLYAVKGYDRDFRVCLCYEKYIPALDETTYGMMVFDKLNGITLGKGSELFSERLHIGGYTEAYLRTFDEDGCRDEKISADMTDFLSAVYDGDFVKADVETAEKFRSRKSRTLVFRLDDEAFDIAVSVYPDGYVSMYSGGEMFLLQIDKAVCGRLWEEVG
ncbi:MAG: hypothetical protein J5999_05455 [Oscillospiraceae bacterium]|nr:hypothetical protein [Oscillospiraceae bacterium]